jgi:hypothetical protein
MVLILALDRVQGDTLACITPSESVVPNLLPLENVRIIYHFSTAMNLIQ